MPGRRPSGSPMAWCSMRCQSVGNSGREVAAGDVGDVADVAELAGVIGGMTPPTDWITTPYFAGELGQFGDELVVVGFELWGGDDGGHGDPLTLLRLRKDSSVTSQWITKPVR